MSSRPTDNLVRRIRELSLLVEISPLEARDLRQSVLTLLADALLRYDAECEDEARADARQELLDNEVCF